MLTTQKRGLDGTALKTIALVLMVMDHIHYFFEFTGLVPEWFSMLGRLSAPLFLFCAVEGFAHTHDRKRYFLRMWGIGAGMGLLTFLMMYVGVLRRPDGFYPLNGIFLNFVILCVVWQGIDWLRQGRYVRGLLAAFGPVLWGFGVVMLASVSGLATPAVFLGSTVLPAWVCVTDGGPMYLVGGVILYLFRDKRGIQLAAWSVWTFGMEFLAVWMMVRSQRGFAFSQMFTVYYEWFSVAAAVLMALYNGRRGAGHKQLFYWFYPAHVYLLYGVSWAVCAAMGAV